MRPFLFAVALFLVAVAKVHATEALIFEGGGYNIQTLVGSTEKPVVGSVRFTPPGASEWVILPRRLLRVEKFDMKKRILIMRFSGPNNPNLPGSFSLSVKKDDAVLVIGGKKIKGTFNWDI